MNFLTTRAIVEDKSLVLSCSINESFVSVGRNQNCYSKYDIGLPFTSVPLYFVAHLISGTIPADLDLISPHRLAVSTLNQIVTALTCALVYVLGLHFSRSKRLAVELAFFFGLATIAWPYATSFFSQPLIGALLLLAIVLLISPDPPRARHLLAAGIALGWACLVRIDTLPLAGLIGLYTFFKCKRKHSWNFATSCTALLALPIIGSLLIYFFFNWWRFGSIVQSGYEGEGWSTPFLVGLYGLTLNPGKGIIIFSPLIIFAIFGLPKLWQKGFSSEVALIVALFVTQLLIYSSWWAWEGGWVWGPRFLIPTLPPMSIGLLPWLSDQSPRYRFLLLIGLTVSFFIQIIGATTDPLMYLSQSGVAYQDTLTLPQYSQVIGQLKDLIDLRVTLIILTNAFGLFTRTQSLIWAFCCTGLIAISAIKLQSSLKDEQQSEHDPLEGTSSLS